MPKQQGEPQAAPSQKRPELGPVIGKQVMQALGKPDDLLRVEVRQLWAAYYRVNVLTGKDAASIRIANSYFLEADGDGNIVGSTPTIARTY